MLRMIIADDEKIIRETIQNSIDWHEIGVEIIGLCKNGIEAYDMILDEYPDIVLTDIQMPGLSGLELIERVSKISADTEFIILSGYGDFEYARTAMRFGIQFYLLKPCNEEDIRNVVLQVKKLCVQREISKQGEYQNLLMLHTLYKSAMKDLIKEVVISKVPLECIAEQYEPFLNFTGVSYQVCSLPFLPEYKQVIAKFADFHQRNAKDIPAFYVRVDDLLYLFFESYNYEYHEMDALFLQVPEYTREAFADIPKLLEQLSALAEGHDTVRLLNMDEPFQTEPEQQASQVDWFALNIMEYVREHISDPTLSLKQIADSVLFMNVDYVSKKFVKGANKKFSVFLAEERVAIAKSMLKTQEYSIIEVAAAVGCQNSPDYFSKFFKKQTGKTPTEYLKQLP